MYTVEIRPVNFSNREIVIINLTTNEIEFRAHLNTEGRRRAKLRWQRLTTLPFPKQIYYTTLKQQFGTVAHDGKEYWLAELPDYTNSVFTGWYGDAQFGESYTSQFSAKAYDSDGNEYKVIWEFEEIKGEEAELDNSSRDWEDVVCVMPL